MEFAAALSVKGGFIEAVDFGLIDLGFVNAVLLLHTIPYFGTLSLLYPNPQDYTI